VTPEERQVEREIWIALERLVTRMENFFAARTAAQKYRADQARWPAGSPGSIGGQFAPANGGTAYGIYLRTGRRPVQLAFAGDDTQLAQAGGPGGGRGGSGQRLPPGAPPQIPDSLAPVRARLYESGVQTLRQLEPNNPLVPSLSPSGYVPSYEALNRLHAEIGQASIRRVANFAMRDGKLIGEQGGNVDVRVLPGGTNAAQDAFAYLSVGGRPVTHTAYQGTLMELPGGAGFVGFRPPTPGHLPTVDINVAGPVGAIRIHYK
jgi:hypothetical protein